MKSPKKPFDITDPRSWVIKISIDTILVLLVITGLFFQWGESVLDAIFMTDAAWAADKAEMQVKITSLQSGQTSQGVMLKTITGDLQKLGKNIQLADAVNTYRSAEQALYLHELDEDRNGATNRSVSRRRELISEQAAAKEFRDCVINNRPNCEALRPR